MVGTAVGFVLGVCTDEPSIGGSVIEKQSGVKSRFGDIPIRRIDIGAGCCGL